MVMRIAIIGAGNVGSALGRAWLKSGEEVVFGVPNPDDPKYGSLAKERLCAPPAAAQNSEIIVLAIPWPATETT
jgi:8-hydroxy-5-deazaflavin:NADPH oxidoreductase